MELREDARTRKTLVTSCSSKELRVHGGNYVAGRRSVVPLLVERLRWLDMSGGRGRVRVRLGRARWGWPAINHK